MKTTVWIPTRNRIDMLERCLKEWEDHIEVDHIVVVVEKWEYGKHLSLSKKFDKVEVIRLPRVNQGVNYARKYIVYAANVDGFKSIIMSDDDIVPTSGTNINRLFEFGVLNTLGIGIMMPFYGLMFGNQTIKDEDRPLMSRGALGKRLFSLDVEKVLEVGNFDPAFHSGWGDDELVREGMAQQQATWYVHAGTMGRSLAGRYQPGGLNDLHKEDVDSRTRGQLSSHEIIYKKWGKEFISKPKDGSRMVCQWKKFMNHYVPDWKERIDWEKK